MPKGKSAAKPARKPSKDGPAKEKSPKVSKRSSRKGRAESQEVVPDGQDGFANATDGFNANGSNGANGAAFVEASEAEAAAAAEADVEATLAEMEGAEVSAHHGRSRSQVHMDGEGSGDGRAVVQGTPAPAQAVLVEATPVAKSSKAHADADEDKPAPPLQLGIRRQLRMSLTGEALVLIVTDPWQPRFEKVKSGAFGGALLAAPMLELLLHGRLKVQRDRFQIMEGPTLPKALEDLAAALDAHREFPSFEAMLRIGKREMPDLVLPWKLRLAELGIFELDRKGRIVRVVDADAQGTLENRLMRVLAGSGVVQAQDTLLLGLAQASGVLPRFVPQSALAFNEKRIKALLSGRDTLDYRVDSGIRNIQELAISTILENVRKLMA